MMDPEVCRSHFLVSSLAQLSSFWSKKEKEKEKLTTGNYLGKLKLKSLRQEVKRFLREIQLKTRAKEPLEPIKSYRQFRGTPWTGDNKKQILIARLTTVLCIHSIWVAGWSIHDSSDPGTTNHLQCAHPSVSVMIRQ